METFILGIGNKGVCLLRGIVLGTASKRKMLAAREDLAIRLLEVADRKNVKLFGMLNETLEMVLKTEDMGLSLDRVVNEYGVVKAAKDAGFVLAVEGLWYEVVDKLFKTEKDWMVKKWYESGQWYGKYYSAKLPQNPLKAFKDDFCSFTWNVSEFAITENKDMSEVVVNCIAPKFSAAQTALFSAFLEGAINVFGFETSKIGVSKGIIQLSFGKMKRA